MSEPDEEFDGGSFVAGVLVMVLFGIFGLSWLDTCYRGKIETHCTDQHSGVMADGACVSSDTIYTVP